MPVPIAIEKLTKRFGSQTVLDGIDLRAVAGLNEPEEGRIFAGDRDVTHVPPHRRDPCRLATQASIALRIMAAKSRRENGFWMKYMPCSSTALRAMTSAV